MGRVALVVSHWHYPPHRWAVEFSQGERVMSKNQNPLLFLTRREALNWIQCHGTNFKTAKPIKVEVTIKRCNGKGAVR